MRRVLGGTLLALVVCAGSGCGDPAERAGAAEGGPGPGKALSYLPAKGSMLVAASTDFRSEQFRTFDRRVVKPILRVGVERLIRESFVDDDYSDFRGSYQRDVRPQLGNDVVLALRPSALLDGTGAVMALQVKDGPAALRLLRRQPGLRREREFRGARLFPERRSRQAYVALEDDVLVAADSERRLRRAIARHDNGNGVSEEGFEGRLGDLPAGALLRVYGELQPLLAGREQRRVRRVPWIRALTSFAATLGVSDGRLRLDGRLNTNPHQITDEDLPLEPGDEAPALVQRARQIAGASANQSQTTVFLLRAARAVAPRSRFVRDVRRLERAHGIDFEDEVLRQFDGPSASLMSLNGGFAARSAVRDPERMADVTRRLAPDLGRLVEDLQALESEGLSLLFLFAPDAPVAPSVLGPSRVKVRRLRGQRDFYRITGLRGEGPDTIYFGLEKGVFVVGSSERRAKAMADAPAAPLRGVRGASITRVDLLPLRRALKRELFFDPGRLGELLGSLDVTQERLRGSLSLEFR